jgi:hypothetical protein
MKKIGILVGLALVLFACENDNSQTCSVSATVRDLTGLDGCGFVFELENGSRLEPVRLIRCGTPDAKIEKDPLDDFLLYDGQPVTIAYEEMEAASICGTGKTVRITCITEVGTISEE